MDVRVAPGLQAGDEIYAVVELCGQKRASAIRIVRDIPRALVGRIVPTLVAGDRIVVVEDAPAGVRLELWEATANKLLKEFWTPFSDDGTTSVSISDFGELLGGWSVYTKFYRCGEEVTSASQFVYFPNAQLTGIQPSSVLVNSGPFMLTLHGQHFRSNAKLYRDDDPSKGGYTPTGWTTTFISSTELRVSVPATETNHAHRQWLSVQQDDSAYARGASNALALDVEHPPAPPPPSGTLTFTIGIGGQLARALDSASFTIAGPGPIGPTTIKGTVDGFKKTASATYSLASAPAGEYYVSVGEVTFTWRDVTDVVDRISQLSGPTGPQGRGEPILLGPTANVVVRFSVNQVGINPPAFSLVRI